MKEKEFKETEEDLIIAKELLDNILSLLSENERKEMLKALLDITEKM